MNERQKYINRVAERLQQMLDAETRLPCKFEIAGGWTSQTDGPISINLDPSPSSEAGERVFEGKSLFAELQQRLNEEFSGDPWYFGIKIGVPHRFLGQQHMNTRLEQEEDNKKYRRVRLRNL